MKMVSMKMSKAEKKKMTEASPMDSPEYPYGLCLNLDKEQIDKLDLGTPKGGETFMLHARAEVKSITITDEKDGKGYKSLSLQITDMALQKDDGMSNEKMAQSLYGKE